MAERADSLPDLHNWINGLASVDSRVREDSARHIYRAGSQLCVPVLDQWMSDAGFREMVKPVDARAPHDPGAPGPRITVGVAVQPEKFESIRSANHSPRLADVPPDQDAREFELRFPGSADLDILTTQDAAADGAIARYLRKFGEGIQQVEVEVRDVSRATEILGAKFGVAAIYPPVHAGADGTRVNFFLAQTPGGRKILVELVEEKSFGDHRP